MKTLNLENLSVQELDAKEMREVRAGWFGPFNAGINLSLRLAGAKWNTFKLHEELSKPTIV